MSDLPKLELRLPVSTAHTVDVTETGGGAASVSNLAIVPADATGYFPSSATSGNSGLLAKIKSVLDASALNGTYTVTLNADGTVTISVAGGGVTAFDLTWDDTALRDWLGFTGNLTAQASYTGTNQCKAVWLPTCGRSEPEGPEPLTTDVFGQEDADVQLAESPGGATFLHSYGIRGRARFTFSHVKGPYTFVGLESFSLVNASAQSFWRNAVQVASMIARYHPDREDQAKYLTCRLDWPRFEPSHVDPRWVGRYSTHRIDFRAVEYVE